MIHWYEGVAVAKVTGYIEADTQEEARKLLEQREYGEISRIDLQALNLMDDLDYVPIEEEEDEV